MRFIDLRRENGKTPFDTVINTGCGPTFVLNRKKYFFFMIKEQCLVFWFRFWLTFCLNPGCSYLEKTFAEIPELMISFSKYTHDIILRGTDEEVCQKCFELLRNMLPTVITTNPIYKKKSVESVIKCQMSRCLDMAFGCALCEVFYKWLNSHREDEGGFNFYWKIPEKYLQPNFTPGIFEQFLVNLCRENFISFIGVNSYQIPWFEDLLSPPGDEMIIPKLNQRFQLPPAPENDIRLWLREPLERKQGNGCYMDRWHYSKKLAKYSKNIRETLWLKRMAILRVDEKDECAVSLPWKFKTSSQENKNSNMMQEGCEKNTKKIKIE
uniref:Uncharacterized protein n=1 Tax=Strigamia maritima TaxID=126957 RepID=T1IGY2_STRMM